MEKFLVFIITFVAVYLLYLFTVVLKKNKMEKYKKSLQIQYFVKKYKLDINKIDITKFSNTISLANAFIIATAVLITEYVSNYFLKLLVAFVVLFPLVLICYSIIGNNARKKVK